MTKNIVFIDSQVQDYAALTDSLGPDTEWFLLNGDEDGVLQMQRVLSRYSALDSIHIVSHGAPGTLYLGSTVLNQRNLGSYESALRIIGESLTDTGDLLIYGCYVAQGDFGVQFIDALASATEAEVGASDDVTGAAALGGNAVLEVTSGTVDAHSLALRELSGLLVVNTAPTFTLGDGKVTTDFSDLRAIGHSVKAQTDGKILLAGYVYNNKTAYSDFALVRYNSDGSLDSSFDTDGKLTTDFGLYDNCFSVYLQADGKILLGGAADGNFALARYNSDGRLDSSFDTDGKLTTDFAGYAYSVTVQSDGKIIMAGENNNGKSYDFALARYNRDGSLDRSFDGDGKLTTDFGFEDSCRDVAVQTDGKILLGGSSYNSDGYSEFALVRYNSDGSLDSSFDTDGKLTTDFGSGAFGNSVTVQANGKIMLAGYAYNDFSFDFALARYNSDGSLDTSFDGDGKLTTNFGSGLYGVRVTVQADGKILLAASINKSNGSSDFALVRYNSDGSLDNSFDTDGKLTTDFGSSDFGLGVTVQADGRILLGGFTEKNLTTDFALARYNSDGSLDTSFSPSENTLAQSEPANYSENTSSVVLAQSAQILDSELAILGSYAGSILTLSRQGGSNTEDFFTNSENLSILTQGSYFSVDSITIGRVISNSNGTLILSFNSTATQSLINKAMQQIAYSNTSDAPPSSVFIDWTFNDGNTGAQGTGGALSVTGTTTVNITATNDAPYLTKVVSDQNIEVGSAFNYQIPLDSFFDADLETLTYTLTMADGTGVPPWISFAKATQTISGTATTADVGTFEFKITATDSSNASAYTLFKIKVDESGAPTLLSSTPADNATAVAASTNIMLTFSEAVQKGAGNIVISNGTDTRTIAVGDAQITVSGSTVTINPTSDLQVNSTYYVQLASGVIRDLAGNSFAGISNTTTLNFSTTAKMPVIDTSLSAAYIKSASQYTLSFDPATQALVVTDPSPQSSETRKFTQATRIEFDDLTLNLSVNDLARTVPQPALDRITELYVAFFNRVPDGDGMEYWIGQYKGGKSINEIAESFYSAGVFFSNLTGYTADMTNDDFINIVYRNVLGRPEGADQGGLDFWRAELTSGRASKGTLVSAILDAAHGVAFSDPNNPYHWVQKLLDNKLDIAKTVSVEWGVNYNTSEDSISKGMAIAAAVTSEGIDDAIELVGVNIEAFVV